MAVLGLGENQPGDKRPERERKAELRGQPRSAENNEEGKNYEDLPAPQAHDVNEHPRHNNSSREDDQGHRQQRRGQAKSDVGCGQTFLTAQDWNQHHHRDDTEILKQQYAHACPAVWGVDFSTVHVALENDGGARKREEKAEEDGLTRTPAQKESDYKYDEDGQGDLEPSA